VIFLDTVRASTFRCPKHGRIVAARVSHLCALGRIKQRVNHRVSTGSATTTNIAKAVSFLASEGGRATGKKGERSSKLKYDAHNPHIDNLAREYSMRFRRARAVKCKACIRGSADTIRRWWVHCSTISVPREARGCHVQSEIHIHTRRYTTRRTHGKLLRSASAFSLVQPFTLAVRQSMRGNRCENASRGFPVNNAALSRLYIAIERDGIWRERRTRAKR